MIKMMTKSFPRQSSTRFPRNRTPKEERRLSSLMLEKTAKVRLKVKCVFKSCDEGPTKSSSETRCWTSDAKGTHGTLRYNQPGLLINDKEFRWARESITFSSLLQRPLSNLHERLASSVDQLDSISDNAMNSSSMMSISFHQSWTFLRSIFDV